VTTKIKVNLIFLFVLIGVPLVFAFCSDEQIDINSASEEKLDEIIWVGPVTAEKIVNARPFENLDSLIDVSGIGEVKLADIKEQGLACVEDEEVEENEEEADEQDLAHVEEDEEEDDEQETETPVYLDSSDDSQTEKSYQTTEEIEAPVINLNAQTIKSEDTEGVLDKGKYSLYGFIGFCFLLIVLFMIKAKKNKNGFTD
tara:strand:- start:187 stop:786 length:600 start_codon:yes stop_codon:yes gene_type:complete